MYTFGPASTASSRSLLHLVAPVLVVSAVALSRAQGPADQRASTPDVAAIKTSIPYAEARPILEALPENIPAELKGKTPGELASAWSGWASRHDTEIRARLARGDEDSLVNLWLYGTTFTRLARATERDMAAVAAQASVAEIVRGRLEDLVAGIASPGTNERLQFARQVIERKGIDPRTAAGKDQVRLHLVEARKRALAEYEAYDRTVAAAKLLKDPGVEVGTQATIFRDRGLSSDTSILADFAIEQALRAVKSQRMFGVGRVRRVAIIGPGLDFTNKADGYDFYPQQTIQPFAVIDSLIRLGLARLDDLRVTTFDLSPRVNQHLEAARERARTGDPYVLHLPLSNDEQWTPGFVAYWEQFGGGIGEAVKAVTTPSAAGDVRVRAVRVDPAVVMSIVPRDLNIVLERIEPLQPDERFDLVIATNILVYYDLFDQALALANVAKMLREEGLLLSNNAVFPTLPWKSSAGYMTVVYSDRQYDHMFSYQKQ